MHEHWFDEENEWSDFEREICWRTISTVCDNANGLREISGAESEWCEDVVHHFLTMIVDHSGKKIQKKNV